MATPITTMVVIMRIIRFINLAYTFRQTREIFRFRLRTFGLVDNGHFFSRNFLDLHVWIYFTLKNPVEGGVVDTFNWCYDFPMTDSQAGSSPPAPVQKKRHGCLKGCLIVFLLLVALIIGGIFTSGDRRSDASILKNYQPSTVIADIALQNTFTDKGKALLYRTNPEFVDGEKFRAICVADGIEGLACTDAIQTTFLQIDDPEFIDHKYSAAAHEMLHVAYRKLKTDERTQVNAWLDQELARHLDDTHLASILNTIKEKKAGDTETMYGELHSKFGVEYADLIPSLEDHYKLYFTDRVQVVRLYQEGGFYSRVRRMDQLNQEGAKLEATINALDKKLRALRDSENVDVDSFNAQVKQFNGLIRQYNAKVAESHKLFAEVERFYRFFNPNYQSPKPKDEQ